MDSLKSTYEDTKAVRKAMRASLNAQRTPVPLAHADEHEARILSEQQREMQELGYDPRKGGGL
jgi:hypothetical protein